RPDELARIARRFTTVRLANGEQQVFAEALEAQRLIVVVEGKARLEVEARGRVLRSVLVPGDRHGDLGLLAGLTHRATLCAEEASTIALLDRAGLDAVIAEFPAVA